MIDPCVELSAIDAVTVADQPRRYCARVQGLDDLLGRPRGTRMCRHVHVQKAPTRERDDEENVHNPKVTVGTVRKSTASVPAR